MVFIPHSNYLYHIQINYFAIAVDIGAVKHIHTNSGTLPTM